MSIRETRTINIIDKLNNTVVDVDKEVEEAAVVEDDDDDVHIPEKREHKPQEP